MDDVGQLLSGVVELLEVLLSIIELVHLGLDDVLCAAEVVPGVLDLRALSLRCQQVRHCAL